MNKTIKTSELSGVALDWVVASIETGIENRHIAITHFRTMHNHYAHTYNLTYSTCWKQGGEIIEREGISVVRVSGHLGEQRTYWVATVEQQGWGQGYGPYHEQDDDCSLQIYENTVIKGSTALIAAMRCFCVMKLGKTVDVPEEFLV